MEADDLERRAERGDSEAQIALARRCEAEQKISLARGWYARAAKQGSIAALRSLAISLLTQPPMVERDGVNMIRSAAHKGDAEAAYVCGMLAAQDHRLPDRWEIARECLERAAERGWEPAQEQLSFLGRIRAVENPAAFTAALPVRSVSEAPRIGVIEGFASKEICEWLVARARPRIARALVYDQESGGGRIEQARSNSSVAFDVAQSDIILMLVRARIAATAQLELDGLEASAVLHYAPGQQFEPHFDFLDSAVPGYANDLRSGGQRVATFLLYLNEGYEGGETEFPEIGWRYKGREGDALLFWNVDESGSPDPHTLHAGLPPATGEKWLLSQWLRRRPQLRP
ncbi:MAG TPA: 2OG-Fe(II) oxygenase [Rhizomicrobium sp.]|nr:2OG-Fe(II) oxygenase [Rhizomicrobium sp.]